MLWRFIKWVFEIKPKKQLSDNYRAYVSADNPRWQKTRQLVFKIWGSRCWYCGATGPYLMAHHTNYKHLGWGGLLEALDCRPICPSCHPTEDYKRKAKKWHSRRRRW